MRRRRVIAASADVREYEPHPHHDWDAAADRLAALVVDDRSRAGLAEASSSAAQP